MTKKRRNSLVTGGLRRRLYGVLACGLVVMTGSSLSVRADDLEGDVVTPDHGISEQSSSSIPVPPPELSAHEQMLFEMLRSKGYTEEPIKVGYDRELKVDENAMPGEYIWQVSRDYYDQFTFDWTDEKGVTHTSHLTDRATNKNHIIALLHEVYTNPLIPGFRRDRFYHPEEVNSAFKVKNDYDGGRYGIDDEGNHVPNAKPERKDHIVVRYDKCDYGQFKELATEDVVKPFNGATALLVEMKDEFYAGEKKLYELFPGLKYGEKPQHEYDRSMDYIEAVSLIPYQFYVTEDANGNPGFLFNRRLTLSKCFVVTKGMNRPYKAYKHREQVNDPDRNVVTVNEIGTTFYLDKKVEDQDAPAFETDAGGPFFNMFEEFSPTNSGPMENAYAKMDGGETFKVDHNCSSVIGQEHTIIFGSPTKSAPDPEGLRLQAAASDNSSTAWHSQKFNVNLMFFLPDRRFDGITNFESGKTEEEIAPDYSCYTFYAKDHMPYFFFNKIHAEIDDVIEVPSDKDVITASGEEVNLNSKSYAMVPIYWKSMYKEIIKQNEAETFTIHRMREGEVQEAPVPLNEIVIRYDYDEESGGVTYVTAGALVESGELLREIGPEAVVFVLEENAYERGGQAVRYIIHGRRAGSDFQTVESNLVLGYLPTIDKSLTIRVDKVYSEFDYSDKENVHNKYTHNLRWLHTGTVQDGFNAQGKPVYKTDQSKESNLTYDDIIEGSMGIVNNTLIAPKFKDVTLELVRHDNVTNENTVVMSWDLSKKNVLTDGPWGDNYVIKVELSAGMVNDTFQDTSTDKLSTGVITDQYNTEKLSGVIRLAYDYTTFNDPEIKGRYSFRPYGDNAEALGLFTDTFAQKVDEAYPTVYTYFLQVMPNNPAAEEGGDSQKIARVGEYKPLVSNITMVTVPERTWRVGYDGYTRDQIEKDTDFYNLLPTNIPGVALTVSNNPYVNAYKFMCVTHGKELARVERYPGGVYRPYLNTNSDVENALENSTDNYSGELSMLLEHDLEPGDDVVMILQFTNTKENVYTNGNTYGFPIKRLPKLPEIDNTVYHVHYSALNPEDDNFTKQYECNIVHSAVIDDKKEDFQFEGYSLWVRPYDTEKKDNQEQINYALNTAKYEHIFQRLSLDPNSHHDMQFFSFYYGEKKPDENKGYVLYADASSRMYSQIVNEDLVIEPYSPRGTSRTLKRNLVAADDEPKYYVVTDYPSTAVLYGAEGEIATGVDGIETDNSNAPVEYFNLQGIRVPADRLAPGIYLRKQGNSTKKVIVN